MSNPKIEKLQNLLHDQDVINRKVTVLCLEILRDMENKNELPDSAQVQERTNGN